MTAEISNETLSAAAKGLNITATLLKKEYLLKIKQSDDLRFILCKVNNVKLSTIERWVRTNDVMLTTAASLKAIASFFNLTGTEGLTE